MHKKNKSSSYSSWWLNTFIFGQIFQDGSYVLLIYSQECSMMSHLLGKIRCLKCPCIFCLICPWLRIICFYKFFFSFSWEIDVKYHNFDASGIYCHWIVIGSRHFPENMHIYVFLYMNTHIHTYINLTTEYKLISMFPFQL